MPVKLKELFDADLEEGLLYVDMQAAETNNREDGRPVYRRALVQVTDLGLTAKFGLADTLIWATELEDGEPREDVKIEIRDSGNNILWRGVTDEQGLAVAPGSADLKPKKAGSGYGEPDLFALAWDDDDFAMVSSGWNEGISPWNFGFGGRSLDRTEIDQTYVMTALPMYKPGEEVRFKVIRRLNTARGLKSSAGQKIKAQIVDSRGKTIEELDLELNNFGTASGRVMLPSYASLGHYSIRIGTPGQDLDYAGYFQVEEYRKPDFEITVKPDREEALAGEKVRAAVEADYHFGAPVRDRPGTYAVTAGPTSFEIPQHEDYNLQDWYSDPDDNGWVTATIASGNLKTDANGLADIDFTAAPGEKPGPWEFMIESTITGVDGRTVSGRKRVLVHPASFYVGLRTDKYLAAAGEKVRLNVVAFRREGDMLPDRTVDLTLYKRTWQTVRRKGVGGYYHYVSSVKDDVVEKLRTRTLGEPVDLDFTPETPGSYFVVATAEDEAGRKARSAAGFYVYGGGPAGWEHYDHDRIDLVSDKKSYKPGEKAVVMVQSPFTSGWGLLTVERNGVMMRRVFEFETSAPTLEVPIEADYSPNVYVSVVLIRGRISDKLDEKGRDPGKPAFKAGYLELKVEDPGDYLHVEVKPDREEARPGEEVSIDVRVTDAGGSPQKAEVALVVVDQALLQLAGDNVYYPERMFFRDQPLGVWTADGRINLIGRRHYGLKGADPGGGGGPGSGVRRKFVSLAFFEPHLVTDSGGRATVRFKLPDNLTTFKIFAVANDEKDKFGTAVTPLLVTKPVLVTSALPSFGGVGDTFIASVSLHNRSDQSGPATVTLSGDGFVNLEPEAKTVDLAAGSGLEVGFPVQIDQGGRAVFRFDVGLAGFTDAAEFPLALRYPNPLETAATFGRLTEWVKENIQVPRGSDPDRGGLTLSTSTSLTGTLDKPFGYLRDYRYDCLEQRTSKALGDLLLMHWAKRLGTSEEDVRAAAERINAYMGGLPSFQKYDGGLSFWPGARESDPYLTAYVVQFLTLAENRNLTIDAGVRDRAVARLQRLLDKGGWPGWYSEQAMLTSASYMTAVLAEAGKPTASYVEYLYQHRDKLDAFQLAQLLTALSLGARTNLTADMAAEVTGLLMNQAVISSDEVHIRAGDTHPGLMGSTVRTNAFALRALVLSDPENPHVVPLANWLVRERRDGHWGGTQSNAMGLLAMTQYIDVMEKDQPNLSLLATLDLVPIAEGDFFGFDSPPLRREVPMPDIAVGRRIPLELRVDGEGAVYYTVSLEYAPKEPDLTSESAGMTLERTYTRLGSGGEGISGDGPFRRGDMVRVEVTMLVPEDRHFVLVEDMLPAGFEPVNFNLPTAPQSLQGLLDQGSKPYDFFRTYWYDHVETRSDRVAVFARHLPTGVYNLTYLARAVTPGEFVAPGPRAEEMYSPQVFGQGAGAKIEVTP